MRKLRANGYEIGFLEGWTDASQVVLLGPERPLFTPNIQIHREPMPEDDVEGFFRTQRAELAGLGGFQLLEHGDRLLGGRTALHHTYSWELPDNPGVRICQRQVAAAHLGELFTITCSALEGDWPAAEGGFELALSGFTWG